MDYVSPEEKWLLGSAKFALYIPLETLFFEDMTKKITLYHNPRCSKSRQTLALLKEKGLEPEVIKYLDTPPDTQTLLTLIGMMEASGSQAHDLLRPKEAPYKELGLSKNSSNKEIAQAINAHPILMERPLAIKGDRAALGRPPENVLKIL